MKASDHIAEHLAARGVDCVFEMTGGMITHLLDSIHSHGHVRIISMHHEQAAAFAAEGWARMRRVPGVALATSGPGATNLLTGVASCWFDSTPAVFITGQVNRAEMRGDRPVRQVGFQETDIVSMARPVTKGAHLLTEPTYLPRRIAEAFDTALSGRTGPVLLDIPMDVQRADIPGGIPAPAVAEPVAPSMKDVDAAVTALSAAEKPVLIAGAGVRLAGGTEALREFASVSGIPVVTSLPGLDAIQHDHPCRVGMLGAYGNRWANEAVGAADLLIVVGSRLDIRQTGALVDDFVAGRTLFHIDVDPAEIGARVQPTRAIVADARLFLEAALAAWGNRGDRFAEWRGAIFEWRASAPDTSELAGLPGINPNDAFGRLSRAAADASAFVVDVGQNQMWAAQSLAIGAGQRFLTSAGLGSMGFALPAAIGAALASAGPVVCSTGDGGLQANLQELETVVRLKLPVKIVVWDNACLGMVRQFQDDYLQSRRQSTEWGYGRPDFVAVANAFGLPASRVSDPEQLDAAFSALMDDPTASALLAVDITGESSVAPKVAFGRPLFDMESPRRVSGG